MDLRPHHRRVLPRQLLAHPLDLVIEDEDDPCLEDSAQRRHRQGAVGSGGVGAQGPRGRRCHDPRPADDVRRRTGGRRRRIQGRSAPMSTGFIENTAGRGAAVYAQKRAARGRPVRGHNPSSRRPGGVAYAVLTGVFVVSVFPLYASAMYGSSTTQENAQAVGTLPTWFPTLTLLDNFGEVLSASQFNFWMAFANSVLVAVSVSASTVFFSTLAGFSFAKLSFRGRQALYLTVIATLAIPAQIGTIPMFVMMNNFGWIDSLLALTIPVLVGAFGVFWMTQYLQSALPFELVEAARVDGASMFRTFWSIAMPAARPAAATRNTPDMTKPVSVVNAPRSCGMTSGIVSCERITTDGQKKLFHEPTKVNSASVAAAGRAAGIAIDQKVRNIDAPSTRAASTSSNGSADWRYCVIQNTPKAPTRTGIVSARSESIHPKLFIMTNIGMVPI